MGWGLGLKKKEKEGAGYMQYPLFCFLSHPDVSKHPPRAVGRSRSRHLKFPTVVDCILVPTAQMKPSSFKLLLVRS